MAIKRGDFVTFRLGGDQMDRYGSVVMVAMSAVGVAENVMRIQPDTEKTVWVHLTAILTSQAPEHAPVAIWRDRYGYLHDAVTECIQQEAFVDLLNAKHEDEMKKAAAALEKLLNDAKSWRNRVFELMRENDSLKMTVERVEGERDVFKQDAATQRERLAKIDELLLFFPTKD